MLALDGAPGDWLPAGFRVIGQRGGGLDERLAAAFADAYAVAPLPMVLIGTDTPQVTVDMLGDAVALARVRRSGRGIRAVDRRRILDARPAPAGPVAARGRPDVRAGTRAASCLNAWPGPGCGSPWPPG